MHKSFKLMMALIIGLFTVPMLGSHVFAQNADVIADGEYDIGVTALEDGTEKESVADDFVHDASITIENGSPSLTLGIGADGEGAYADFNFSINWVKIEGKEPANERDEGDLTYYTFPLNSLDTKIPAEMEYVVPDFPPLADGHEVDFDLKLDGLDDLPEKGDVKVTYVDQNGDEIAGSETLEGKIGADYEAEQKDIDGYNFAEVNGDKTGEFAKETTMVEFVYEKEQEKAPEERKTGDLLTVNEADAVYELDYETDSKATAGQLGSPVQLLEKDDDQYIQMPVKENGAQFFRSLQINGKEVTWNSITEGPYTIQFELPSGIGEQLDLSMVIQPPNLDSMSHDVKLWFDEDSLETIKEPESPEKPEEQGEVTVIYVDQNGDEIADPKTLEGNIGASYEVDQKTIDGYKFKEVNGEKEGEFAKEITTVKYVYEKEGQEEGPEKDPESPKPEEQGEVTVTYVDQDGTEIADPETLEGDIGTSYEADQKDVDGYDFVKVSGDEKGEFNKNNRSIEYEYEQTKQAGNNNKNVTEEVNGTDVENADDDKVNPKTGEDSNVLLYVFLLIGSGIPLAFVIRRRLVKS